MNGRFINMSIGINRYHLKTIKGNLRNNFRLHLLYQNLDLNLGELKAQREYCIHCYQISRRRDMIVVVFFFFYYFLVYMFI